MARDGGFRDLDAVLAWHPGDSSGVNNSEPGSGNPGVVALELIRSQLIILIE